MGLENLEVLTPDGEAQALFAISGTGRTASGVILLTDIFGIRPAYEALAHRIAARGYAVLIPQIFYRTTGLPIFDFAPNFQEDRTRNRMNEVTAPLKMEAMERDAAAYVDFMVSEGIDRLGVVGFCFSGKFALRAAAARPDQVLAAASFHGGGLYTDEPDSPHHALPRITASLYFGHAENDRSMPAESIEKLDRALEEWGGEYQSETYAGAAHGWMIPGREIYNEQQAERGFAKMMELFDRTLREPASKQ